MGVNLKHGRVKQTIDVFTKLLGLGLALILCLFALQSNLRASENAGTIVKPSLTAAQVASRMVTMNKRRTEALRSYTSLRTYHLALHGMINIHADMEVKMTYRYPGTKNFTILSQSGSAFMRNHVLKRLLKAEIQTSRQGKRRLISVTPYNYKFEMVGYKNDAQGGYYILKATPKRKGKYLFKGRIWVSGRNFALMHIQGKPAKRVSWWIPKVNIVYNYKRVGGFWFPALNKTVTHVRIFGRSVLTIQYKDYDLTDARNVQPFTPAKLALTDRGQDLRLISPDPLR